MAHSYSTLGAALAIICYTNLRFTYLLINTNHLVTLAARSSTSSSSQINNRPYRYASPHLWNQLPSSLHQPHLFTLLILHISHITVFTKVSSSITISVFQSRLKLICSTNSFLCMLAFNETILRQDFIAQKYLSLAFLYIFCFLDKCCQFF